MNKTLKKTLAIILAALMLSASATVAFAAEKKVSIVMYDSFGDGWDNACIEVSKLTDGVPELVKSITLRDGGHDIAEFLVSDSDVYIYEWHPGGYPEECSFRITIGGVDILTVNKYRAPVEKELLYIDCKHLVEGTECINCGFTCGTDFSHSFTQENSTCICGARCPHEFISTGLCKLCGIECSHDEYGDITHNPVSVSGTSGMTILEEFDNLFDGESTTKWCGDFDESDLPYFIFRYNYPVKLTGYTLTTANDADLYPERNWKNWTVYGSDSEDGEWTVVHEVKDAELPATGFTETDAFEVNSDTAYKYYKVVVNENGGEGRWGNSHQMAEFTPVTEPASYYGCLTCGMEYKMPAEEEPTDPTEPDDSEDTAEICSFCGKAHDDLLEEIICLIMEFFHLIMKALKIS